MLVDRITTTPLVVAPQRSFNMTWPGLLGLPADMLDRMSTMTVSAGLGWAGLLTRWRAAAAGLPGCCFGGGCCSAPPRPGQRACPAGLLPSSSSSSPPPPPPPCAQLSANGVDLVLQLDGAVKVAQQDSVTLQLHSTMGILIASYSRSRSLVTLQVTKQAVLTTQHWRALGIASGSGGGGAGGDTGGRRAPALPAAAAAAALPTARTAVLGPPRPQPWPCPGLAHALTPPLSVPALPV
jgi:hypothetical protein